MRLLVAGWFSFRAGHATAGDLMARDLACEWIASAGCTYDVAAAEPFEGDVDILKIDPRMYTHLLFVCGPFQKNILESILLRRFWHCRLIGLNLTMRVPLEEWNPFDILIERDSSRSSNPDMALLSTRPLVPVVGLCLVEPYERALYHLINPAIERLFASREVAVVPIDTRLDVNSTGLRTPAEIESLLARMDAVVTTRLHGTVLSLKNGVPPLVIDPEAGGAKVRRQADSIGWPVVFNGDELDDLALQEALDYCLSADARTEAARCAERASKVVDDHVRSRVLEVLADPSRMEQRYAARMAAPMNDDWIVAFERQMMNDEATKEEDASRSLKKRMRRLLATVAWWTLPAPIHARLKLIRRAAVSAASRPGSPHLEN